MSRFRCEFTTKTKVQAFERSKGRCDECTARLGPGNVEYDHRIPDAMGGDNSLANCMVLCRACHRLKTTKTDVPQIAKAKRREARHLGIKKTSSRPMPGSKASGWKIPFNGKPERRL